MGFEPGSTREARRGTQCSLQERIRANAVRLVAGLEQANGKPAETPDGA